MSGARRPVGLGFAVVAMVIVGLAVWMVLDSRSPHAASPREPGRSVMNHPALQESEAKAPIAPAAAVSGAKGQAVLAVAAGSTAQSAASMAPGSPRKPLVKPGEVDICGIGIRSGEALAVPDAAPDASASLPQLTIAPQRLVETGLPELWRRLGEAMRNSLDPRQQAAALIMNLPADGKYFHAAVVGEQLRQLALRSKDPLILQWAFSRCRANEGANCPHALARQWVRTEPGNLMSWLALLADEPAAQAEALHGMALARFVDIRAGQLQYQVDTAIPDDMPPYLRMSAVIQAVGVDAALLANLSALSRLCGASATADANRYQQCDAIAHVMVDHGRDLLTLAFGRRLAERLGWPADRLRQLNDEVASLSGLAAAKPGIDLAQPYSCESIASLRQWVKSLAVNGELGWLRGQAGLRR